MKKLENERKNRWYGIEKNIPRYILHQVPDPGKPH
jgi:hypothetical protein